MDSPGITLAKKIDKMGMRCSDTAVIYFDDVRVPASHIIGEAGGRGVQAPPGRGFTYQMMQFQDERLMAAASCLTPMVRHIEDTIGYTRSPAAPHLPRERKVFGAPLLDNQYLHFRSVSHKDDSAGCVLLPIFLYFLYRRKKFLYSYIGRPKSTKPPIFGPHLT